MSFATSVSVRCSRLRNSLFGRRNGPTARFWMAGLTNRSFVLARIFASYMRLLIVHETFYEQSSRRNSPAPFVRFWTRADKVGFLARGGLSANDPKRTLAVHC